jgi:hypothetical protein
MMDRTWSVEIEGKKHLVEVDYGRNASQTGKLLVDGNELQSWKNAQHLDVPPEITFQVEGRLAVLRARGFLNPRTGKRSFSHESEATKAGKHYLLGGKC